MICTTLEGGGLNRMVQAHNDDRDASGIVSYSVKELLGEIKSSIDRLDVKLSSKADREEVLALTSQLARDVRDLDARLHHERQRIDQLAQHDEAEDRAHTNTREWRKWVIPVLVSIVVAAEGMVQLLQK